MLYKFKSKDAGNVIMLEPNGRRVLEIIGKDAGPQGIILPEQMPAAIKALEVAIALEESGDQEAGVASVEGLGLRQRAMPFIDMLQRNYKSGHEVVWGV
ncbi:MAG: DUF1840 domain-containing protein [Polaromonas sp.]|jgi:hypothetical protein|uniref:DUF1840 domain-containing protein n=1 Tax=Polaromonas sp. TaxID=1869339 RepID=UPI0017BAD4F3|nr:DUF1840 domain-containing protein [Polaromonas sp.]NMM09009.1 DUF1840 domain-containing protein [Polaromonas sp.]